MSPRDAIAILIIVAMWVAVFVPVLFSAFHELHALKSNDKCGSRREEFKARLQSRARWLVPVYWLAAGVCTGGIADHPVPVGAGVLFVRSLFYLLGGMRGKTVGIFLLHVLGFGAGALLGHWIHAALNQ
jgi:hypothetical protein